jgi:hypothetical protein
MAGIDIATEPCGYLTDFAKRLQHNAMHYNSMVVIDAIHAAPAILAAVLQQQIDELKAETDG